MLVWKGNFAGLVSQSLFLVLKKKTSIVSVYLGVANFVEACLYLFACLFDKIKHRHYCQFACGLTLVGNGWCQIPE